MVSTFRRRDHALLVIRAHAILPQMEWLPPSPDGIAMCQSRGVESHTKRRTAT